MKLSQLIAVLQAQHEEYGDLNCYCQDKFECMHSTPLTLSAIQIIDHNTAFNNTMDISELICLISHRG